MVKSRLRAPEVSAKVPSKPSAPEPNFVLMLADPEVRLLMRADNVDESELLAMLKTISVHLRGGELKDRKGPGYRVPNAELRKYRRGIGIMLINDRAEIFVARRNDVPGDSWQMPQGGIDRGETAEQAAFRELKEEIGTNNAQIVAESSNWLYYELPDEMAKKVWGGRWKGQRQKWFAMLFRGEESEIDLATSQPEFDAWRWVAIGELESLAVSFKRRLYVSLLEEFAKLFPGRAERPSPGAIGDVGI